MIKPPVYKCGCARPFTPKGWPYTHNCQCGASITVNKPMKEPAK